ncbi:MAG: ATP-binding protein, partial [Candidatus Atribacteria bacterium]|nr:ATP-binding protein [Candidatus Atribacteria bacterium]
PLLSDREQWMMAIENLLDNQIRYAVHTVSLTLQINSFSTIVLRIGNDGPAIEARLLPHLFQAFHHGQKGEFGLGLSIVKRIITLQGGTIEARNEENGVTFILHIPIHHG